MQYKVRTFLLLFLVPTWIFISNIVVPWGTSEIVGKLSGGDFEFEVRINGISTEDELQDTFLEFVEENNI